MSFIFAQIFNGLVNGGFIALMSLGLSIVFGLMRVVNFAHGAIYMLGAFVAFIAGSYFGISLWFSLILALLLVGGFGVILERTLLSRLYGLDPAYNLLLTFGLTLIIEDVMRQFFATTGAPFLMPESLRGAINLGFMYYPKYRLFVVVLSLLTCLSVWLLIEKTRLGALIRAGTERPNLLSCFGGNVKMLVSITFFCASGLAGLAGALAAPIRNVSPFMGQEMIALTFAVVVAGGMGSIAGSVIMGFVVGVLSSLAAIWYPAGSIAIIYIVMLVVLVLRPGGIFRGVDISHFPLHYTPITERARAIFESRTLQLIALPSAIALPWFVYPVRGDRHHALGALRGGLRPAVRLRRPALLRTGGVFWGAAAYATGVLVAKFGAPNWIGFLGGVAAARGWACCSASSSRRRKASISR